VSHCEIHDCDATDGCEQCASFEARARFRAELARMRALYGAEVASFEAELARVCDELAKAKLKATARVHFFERVYVHECDGGASSAGYLHTPGEATHVLPAKAGASDKIELCSVEDDWRVGALICNGCHGHGGVWRNEHGRRFPPFIIMGL
jgi:hypothetical protein